MSVLSRKSPSLVKTLRPSLDETERYARLILHHEGRPPSALPDCRREAELQLWADRSFGHLSLGKGGRRSSAAG